MPVEAPSKDPIDYRDEPTYWFAVMEIARQRGDFAQAAEAKRQLRRLGISVSYEPPQPGKGVAQ